jgi:hypothetical protein
MNDLELSDDVLELHQKMDELEATAEELRKKLTEAYDALAHQHNVVTAIAKLALRIQ